MLPKIGMVKRLNKSNGFTKFDMLITKDGKTWETYKTRLTFDQTTTSEQFFKLDEPMNLRGVKIVMTEGVSKFAYLAEFKAYTIQ